MALFHWSVLPSKHTLPLTFFPQSLAGGPPGLLAPSLAQAENVVWPYVPLPGHSCNPPSPLPLSPFPDFSSLWVRTTQNPSLWSLVLPFMSLDWVEGDLSSLCLLPREQETTLPERSQLWGGIWGKALSLLHPVLWSEESWGWPLL